MTRDRGGSHLSGRSISAAIATFLVLGTALPAMAFVIQQGQTIAISETLRDDLYAAGETVLVTGAVDGDVAAAARNIAIGRKVTGGVPACAPARRSQAKPNGFPVLRNRSTWSTASLSVSWCGSGRLLDSC